MSDRQTELKIFRRAVDRPGHGRRVTTIPEWVDANYCDRFRDTPELVQMRLLGNDSVFVQVTYGRGIRTRPGEPDTHTIGLAVCHRDRSKADQDAELSRCVGGGEAAAEHVAELHARALASLHFDGRDVRQNDRRPRPRSGALT